MCSLLVFAKPDNNHPDPSLDWTKYKRGDVIEARDEDEFFWGEDVQGRNCLGFWEVIVVPGVPASDFQSLWATEQFNDSVTAARLRINNLDLTAIMASQTKSTIGVFWDKAKAFVTGVRTTVVADKETVLSFVSMKPAVIDMNVLGDELETLG